MKGAAYRNSSDEMTAHKDGAVRRVADNPHVPPSTWYIRMIARKVHCSRHCGDTESLRVRWAFTLYRMIVEVQALCFKLSARRKSGHSICASVVNSAAPRLPRRR